MPTITVTYESEAERIAYQRAIDYAAEMLRVAQAVPDAQVVDACEGLARDQGRQLLRDSLSNAIQSRIDVAEKKRGTTPNDSHAATSAPTKGDADARF